MCKNRTNIKIYDYGIPFTVLYFKDCIIYIGWLQDVLDKIVIFECNVFR